MKDSRPNIPSRGAGFSPSPENGITSCFFSNKNPLLIKIAKSVFHAFGKTRREKTMPFFGAGFSLIEILVTIGIFALVSGIILASYPRFSNRLLFTRTVQDVAQSIRKAQTYSIGVREFQGFDHPYGVYFSISDIMSEPKQKYIFFADLNDPSNRLYDYGVPEDVLVPERIDLLELPSSMKIVQLCAGKETSPPGNCSISALHITYKRPAPITYFYSNVGNNAEITDSDVEIIFEDPYGSRKEIVVWKTGQISIKDLPNP